MSVYAVYGLKPEHAEWDLREVFETQEEARRAAEQLIEAEGQDGGWTYGESVVTVFDTRDDVLRDLPGEDMVGITNRYARTEAAIPQI